MIENQNLKLYIKNTPSKYSLESLKLKISNQIAGHFRIKKRKANQGGRKKAHAILTLANLEDRDHLLSTAIELNGKTLVFEQFKTSKELNLETALILQRRVYINGISHNVKRERVKEEFSKYGEIERIFFKKTKSKSPGGSFKSKCYITFKHKESVEACMCIHPYIFLGKKITLSQKEHIHNIKRRDESPPPPGVHRDSSVNYNDDAYWERGRKLENSSINDIKGRTERPGDALGIPHGAFYKVDAQSSRGLIRNQIFDEGSMRCYSFGINPFRDLLDLYSDWMNQTVDYYFDISEIVPRITDQGYPGRRMLQPKSNYNHHLGNLKFKTFKL